MAIKVSNGTDTFEVDEDRLSEAQKDGFVPTIKVSNGKQEFDVHPNDVSKAEKDGFKPLAKPRTIEAALEGFGEGATLGYLNNLQALAEKPIFAAMNAITGQDVEADDYVKARDYYNKRQDSLQKENPAAFGEGQVGGTIVSSIPVARAAQGATAVARALQAAKAGALYGGLQNTSEKEGELGGLNAAERIENAAFGGVMGAGSSLGVDAAGKMIQKGANAVSATRNKLGEYFKKGAEDLAENATGATRVQAEKLQDGSGRYLLDNKLVGFGDTAEDVAKNANKAISQAEASIDQSLKSLDNNGVQVSQDKIIQTLQQKITDLGKDSSKADVVKKLNSIIDDIINTGESNLSPSSAEQVKRGFNKMAKNWQDPEKGEAGKIAYRAYRDAVEETAKAADPTIAGTFKEAKSVYGKLAPISEAAEKRALQLQQSPIGGLLDTAAVIGGAVGSDDPLSGGLAGIGTAMLRRKVSPRLASSMAVTFDKVSQRLLQNPQMAQLAKVNPNAFKATVFSLVEKQAERNQIPSVMPKAAENDKPQKGPDKWVNDGVEKLNSAGIPSEVIDGLKSTKQGRELLIEASDAKPNSKRMQSVIEKIRSASRNEGE